MPIKTIAKREEGECGFEVNIVEENSIFFRLVNILSDDLWLDSRGKQRVFLDCSLFSTYQESCRRSILLGDCSRAPVIEQEHVDIRLLFGLTLILHNVLHWTSIPNNLSSESILLASGYMIRRKINLLLPKVMYFWGKIVVYGLFKLNVIESIDSEIDSPKIKNTESCNI